MIGEDDKEYEIFIPYSAFLGCGVDDLDGIIKEYFLKKYGQVVKAFNDPAPIVEHHDDGMMCYFSNVELEEGLMQ